MIDFLEIKDKDRVTVGIIDTANSVIWHKKYYDVGDFEVYIQAAPKNVELLQPGNYVLRQNDDEVGIIEKIEFNFSVQNGYMLTASGRFAKSILNRRLIYSLSGTVNTPTILSGNVETAVRQVVSDNIISCSFDNRRNIPILALGELKGYTDVILGENGEPAQKQVSYQNLMEYTDSVLKEYKMSANLIYDDMTKKFLYTVNKGADRTSGEAPVIFSVDFDNLLSSNYQYNEQPYKNAALIGGAGQDLERFYSLLTENKSGLELREIFVDASGVNRKYREEGDTEDRTYTDAEYSSMLAQKGQEKLDAQIKQILFDGKINVSFGVWVLNRDYFLGDLVTIQDNVINQYANVRIVETTEVQDANGYTVDVVFGE